MFDFRDIMAANKADQIRSWSIEQAIDASSGSTSGIPTAETIVYKAAMIEDFVLNGKKEN